MIERRQPITPLSGATLVQRESTRTWIALLVIGGFFLLAMAILLGGWILRGLPTTEVLQVFATVSSVFGALAGAAIGFYFRGEEKD